MTDARTLTLALGGRWHGRYGVSPCPICQPERQKGQNALTLADGNSGLLLSCKKAGCSFRDILAAAGVMPGDYAPPDAATIAQREAEQRREAEKRERQARALWAEALPIGGTAAESYLRGRAITCALPETLRFHPACWHGATATRPPALVARVDGGAAFAVHRTYLRPDGSGKADLTPNKAMLGATAGGAVRLAGGQGVLAVAEGLETGLSLLCGVLSGPAAVWAALSSSGFARLHLPSAHGRLIVATDADDKGVGAAAGNALAERAAALGWTVTLLPAPEGRDWNDVIRDTKGAAA